MKTSANSIFAALLLNPFVTSRTCEALGASLTKSDEGYGLFEDRC